MSLNLGSIMAEYRIISFGSTVNFPVSSGEAGRSAAGIRGTTLAGAAGDGCTETGAGTDAGFGIGTAGTMAGSATGSATGASTAGCGTGELSSCSMTSSSSESSSSSSNSGSVISGRVLPLFSRNLRAIACGTNMRTIRTIRKISYRSISQRLCSLMQIRSIRSGRHRGHCEISNFLQTSKQISLR